LKSDVSPDATKLQTEAWITFESWTRFVCHIFKHQM